MFGATGRANFTLTQNFLKGCACRCARVGDLLERHFLHYLAGERSSRTLRTALLVPCSSSERSRLSPDEILASRFRVERYELVRRCLEVRTATSSSFEPRTLPPGTHRARRGNPLTHATARVAPTCYAVHLRTSILHPTTYLARKSASTIVSYEYEYHVATVGIKPKPFLQYATGPTIRWLGSS